MLIKTDQEIKIDNAKFELKIPNFTLKIGQIFSIKNAYQQISGRVEKINMDTVVFSVYKPSLSDFDLFVFDLDGTLLNKESEIFESSVKALHFLIKNNKKIIFATGRPIYTGKRYGNQIGIKTECIFSNGGMTYDLSNNQITDLKEIPYEEAKEVFDFITSQKYDFLVYSDIGLTSYDFKRTDFVQKREYPKHLGKNYFVGESFEQLKGQKITKFLIILDSNENNKKELKEKCIEFFKDKKESYFLQSHPNFFDVMSKKASKGSSLEKILDKLNIDPNRVMSFGDADNDVSNFKICGYGVSMKNGSHNALEYSNLSLDNNQETWLLDFVINELAK